MDRDAFLGLVRRRLEGVDVPPLPDHLPATFASGDGRLFDRFAAELAKVGGEARLVHTYELADAIAELAEGRRLAVVARDVGSFLARVEEGLRRVGCEAVTPTREAAAEADLGVTGAVLAVASTGSVLLATGPDSPRVTSLLPPIHVAVVRDDALVPGFEELFEELPRHASRGAQTVLITGPSRTADIEQTLVRGVHGPTRTAAFVVTT